MSGLSLLLFEDWGAPWYTYLYLYLLWVFMGAALCSGVQCAVYRVKHGLSWVHGRSVCEGCGAILRWWQLIPIFGALLNHGKCPVCSFRVGYKYTVAELMSGLALASLVVLI